MGARDGDVMSIAWELQRGFDARDWTAARGDVGRMDIARRTTDVARMVAPREDVVVG